MKTSWSPVTESNRRPSPYHGNPQNVTWPGAVAVAAADGAAEVGALLAEVVLPGAARQAPCLPPGTI